MTWLFSVAILAQATSQQAFRDVLLRSSSSLLGMWAKASSYGKSGGGDGGVKGGSPYGGKGSGKSKGNDDGKFELLRQQQKEIADLKQQLETERLRVSDLEGELDVERYWTKQLEKALGI